jgi:hypothetical protein
MICTFDIVRLGTYNEEKDLRHFGTEKRLYKDVKKQQTGRERLREKRIEFIPNRRESFVLIFLSGGTV